MSTRQTNLMISAVALLLASIAGAEDTTSFGEPLTPSTPIRIAELLADPERYVGAIVKVEGLVEDVCPMKGCWIDILEEQSQETLRFKVADDVIVFPATAKGRAVVAEGVFSKRELSKEQAISWMRHLAEEKGEPFDEASVTGPMVLYQIDGIGAAVSSE